MSGQPQTPRVEANVKINPLPMFLTAIFTTAAAAAATYFVMKKINDGNRKLEEDKEQERVQQSSMFPAPMWPGMQPQPQSSPALEKTASTLESLTERLESWQNDLARREQMVQAHVEDTARLRLVGNGDEYYEEE